MYFDACCGARSSHSGFDIALAPSSRKRNGNLPKTMDIVGQRQVLPVLGSRVGD